MTTATQRELHEMLAGEAEKEVRRRLQTVSRVLAELAEEARHAAEADAGELVARADRILGQLPWAVANLQTGPLSAELRELVVRRLQAAATSGE